MCQNRDVGLSLNHVERRLARLQRWNIVLLMGIIVSLTVGARQVAQKAEPQREMTIVDAKGKPRIKIGPVAGAVPGFGIEILGADGTARSSLIVADDASMSGLVLQDPGKGAITLGVNGGQSVLLLASGSGVVNLSSGGGQAASPVFAMNDRAGTLRVAAGLGNGNQPNVELYDSKGTVYWQTPATPR